MTKETFSAERQPDLSTVPAIILCAGKGSRMGLPIENRVPKSLVEIEPNRVLLQYVMELLVASGVTDATLCVAYQAENIIGYFRSNPAQLNLDYSKESFPRSVMETFRSALRNLDPKTDFLLLHGDEIILNVSLRDMFSLHKSHHGVATALLSNNAQAEKTVIMKLENSGLVSNPIRNSPDHFPTYSASLGLFLFRPDIKQEVGRFVSWEEMIRTLAYEGKLYGFPSDAYFFNINSPPDIQRFLDFCSQTR
ncbi:MAG: sugar phosphate nucleotidyltransferase [Candidatus Curtissbacteria bacterium]|nr:sugar phosphate nucleotidyltransferase [Candidatus Curtissbacteria bacterium]